MQADLRYINRDAAALLLSRSAASGADGGSGLTFLDVRRHDERTLYGSIPRAQHVPGAGRYSGFVFYSSTIALRLRNMLPGGLVGRRQFSTGELARAVEPASMA